MSNGENVHLSQKTKKYDKHENMRDEVKDRQRQKEIERETHWRFNGGTVWQRSAADSLLYLAAGVLDFAD